MFIATHPCTTIDAPRMPPIPRPTVPIPNPTQLLDKIPLSAQWNLYRVLEEGTRYEGKIYGYFNSAITEIFPVSKNFQVRSLLHPAVSKIDQKFLKDKSSISSPSTCGGRG